MRFNQCSNLEFYGMRAFASPGFFLLLDRCDTTCVDSCEVLVHPGRWRSINGDGVHVIDSTSTDISQCTFNGLGDDCINFSISDNFTVDGCTFQENRRMAIILDGLEHHGPEAPSTNGSITNCVASNNGGSFLFHFEFNYDSISLSGNTSYSNNTLAGSHFSKHVQIRSLVDPKLYLGMAPSDGGAQSGDLAVLRSGSPDPALNWDLIFLSGPEGGYLLKNRGAHESGRTLYAAADSAAAPMNYDPIVLEDAAPLDPNGLLYPQDHLLVVGPPLSNGAHRISLKAQGTAPTWYLSARRLGDTWADQDPIVLRPSLDAPSAPGGYLAWQQWIIEPQED